MSDKLGTCSDCEYWNPAPARMEGECRNRSPTVDPQAYMGLHGEKEIRGPKTLWPETRPTDWCGDHMNKMDDD